MLPDYARFGRSPTVTYPTEGQDPKSKTSVFLVKLRPLPVPYLFRLSVVPIGVRLSQETGKVSGREKGA